MRSKGSRFTLGVWGLWARSLDVAFASATVRNRPQPSATVRNRSCEVPMAVPMGSAAKAVNFGGFKRCVTSFHVAGVALCDIPTFFITCRKSFLCDRRNTFGSRRWLSTLETSMSFRVAGAAFGADPSCVEYHFAWQAQYLGHSTLYTLHFPLHTLHCTLHTLHFIL